MSRAATATDTTAQSTMKELVSRPILSQVSTVGDALMKL